MADAYRVMEADLKKVASMKEGSKKRVERDQQLLAAKKQAIAEKRAAFKTIRQECAARTLKYEEEYKQMVADAVAAKRAAKAEGGFYKAADPKIAFVVRIKGVNKLAPAPRRAFQLFRLLQIHNGVFIKLNKATEQMLKLIEPFVVYGTPSLSLIRKLIYKRGFLRVGQAGSRQRVRIQHNEIISEKLGQYGIHCVEDMVHEIYTAGPHFKQVTNFLWAFKLKSPKGGYVCKRHGFAEFRKGDWGNRYEKVNEFVERMI